MKGRVVKEMQKPSARLPFEVKLRWTQAWRRQNKKGKVEEGGKKKARKAVVIAEASASHAFCGVATASCAVAPFYFHRPRSSRRQSWACPLMTSRRSVEAASRATGRST